MLAALTAIIGDISIREHYPLSASYIFGTLYILGGMIGTVIIGKHVQKQKQYKMIIAILCATSFSFLFTLFAFLKKDIEWVSSFLFIGLGFCLIPLYAISIDFGAKLT